MILQQWQRDILKMEKYKSELLRLENVLREGEYHIKDMTSLQKEVRELLKHRNAQFLSDYLKTRKKEEMLVQESAFASLLVYSAEMHKTGFISDTLSTLELRGIAYAIHRLFSLWTKKEKLDDTF